MLTLMALTGIYQIYRKTTGKELKVVVILMQKVKSLSIARKAKITSVCSVK